MHAWWGADAPAGVFTGHSDDCRGAVDLVTNLGCHDADHPSVPPFSFLTPEHDKAWGRIAQAREALLDQGPLDALTVTVQGVQCLSLSPGLSEVSTVQ